MGVDEADTVDLMSIDPSGAIVLTVSDHLDWTDSRSHQYTLQAKLNRYLAFIESGEILQHLPDAAARQIVIRVFTICEPDADGRAFLQRAQGIIEQAGFGFEHRVFRQPQ